MEATAVAAVTTILKASREKPVVGATKAVAATVTVAIVTIAAVNFAIIEGEC